MIKERLYEAANIIELSAEHFNMREGLMFGSDRVCSLEPDANGRLVFKGDCETTACIAGIGYLMKYDEIEWQEYSRITWDVVSEEAQEYFDLTDEQADELFNTPIAKVLGIADTTLSRDIDHFESPEAYAKAAAERIRKFAKDNQNY